MSKGSKYRTVSNKEAFNINWNNIFNKKELKETRYKEEDKADNEKRI